MATRNKILVAMGITLFLFIITVFVFVWNEKPVPDSLIYSTFGLFTGELGILGWIKVKGD